jgi:hypothetical protein
MTDLVATFATRADVRRAVVDLERHGAVDADRVELEGLEDTTDELGRRAADREVVRDMGTRSLSGAVIGALIGLIVGGGIALLAGADLWAAAAIGGALFGGAAGFFYGLAARTPVTESAIEGTTGRDDGPATMIVHLDDDEAAGLVATRLRELGAEVRSS